MRSAVAPPSSSRRAASAGRNSWRQRDFLLRHHRAQAVRIVRDDAGDAHLDQALHVGAPRLRLRGSDRALMVWLTRLWPSLLGAAHVVRPETIICWYRDGF